MTPATLFASKLKANQRLICIEERIERARQEFLEKCLYDGKCEPCIVIADGSEALAAVACSQMNSYVYVKFSSQMTSFLKQNYGLKKGSHLLAVNTYQNDGANAADLKLLDKSKSAFVNVRPIIAECLADSKDAILDIHQRLSPDCFKNFEALYQQEFTENPKHYRSSIPIQSNVVLHRGQNNIGIVSNPEMELELEDDDTANPHHVHQASLGNADNKDPGSFDFTPERTAYTPRQDDNSPLANFLLNTDEAVLLRQLEEGGRFYCYQYAVGALVISFKFFSGVRYDPPGTGGFIKRFIRGVPYSIITIPLGILGKWSILWSIEAILRNSFGGINLTKDIADSLKTDLHRKSARSILYE